MHQPHDAEAKYVQRLAVAHAAAAQRLHDAGERFDQRPVDERYVLRKPERVAYVLRRNAKEFGQSAGFDGGLPPRGALHVVAARAHTAVETRRVMVHEDAIARREAGNARPGRGNDARGFVAEHERRFAPNVPRHHIARANAAGARLHQQFAVAGARNIAFFDADVVHVVENRRSHFLRAHGSIANFTPSPPSSRSKTAATCASGTVWVTSGSGSKRCCASNSYARRTARGVK